jgi:hypothetical protein
MTTALILLLNRVAASAPMIVIGVSLVAILIAPRLRLLHFPGLVIAKRKAGSR